MGATVGVGVAAVGFSAAAAAKARQSASLPDPPKSARECAEQLEHSDEGIRRRAAEALCFCGEEALEHADRVVRHAATRALGWLGALTAECIAWLAKAAKDDKEGEVRQAALVALAQVLRVAGQAAAEEHVALVQAALVMAAAEDADWRTRTSAVKILAQLLSAAGPAATEDHVAAVRVALSRAATEDIYWSVRKTAVEALAQILAALGLAAAGEHVAVVVAALQDEDMFVRCAAAKAMGEMGAAGQCHTDDVAKLMQQDASSQVRAEAAKALGGMGAAAVCHRAVLLLTASGDAEEHVRVAAVEALAQVLDAAGAAATAEEAPVVARALQANTGPQSGLVRCNAARVLGKMGAEGQAYVKDVAKLLQVECSKARCGATQGLSGMGAAAAAQRAALVKAAEDAEDNVRGAAVEALAQVLDAAGVASTAEEAPVVARALQAASGWVRCNAARVLGKMGAAGQAYVEDVAKLLQDEHLEARCGAAQGLGGMGAAAVGQRAELAKAAEDADHNVGAAAVEALAQVLDAAGASATAEEVRLLCKAARVLGKTGAAAAMYGAVLAKAAAEDADKDVRLAALEALVQLEELTPERCAQYVLDGSIPEVRKEATKVGLAHRPAWKAAEGETDSSNVRMVEEALMDALKATTMDQEVIVLMFQLQDLLPRFPPDELLLIGRRLHNLGVSSWDLLQVDYISDLCNYVEDRPCLQAGVRRVLTTAKGRRLSEDRISKDTCTVEMWLDQANVIANHRQPKQADEWMQRACATDLRDVVVAGKSDGSMLDDLVKASVIDKDAPRRVALEALQSLPVDQEELRYQLGVQLAKSKDGQALVSFQESVYLHLYNVTGFPGSDHEVKESVRQFLFGLATLTGGEPARFTDMFHALLEEIAKRSAKEAKCPARAWKDVDDMDDSAYQVAQILWTAGELQVRGQSQNAKVDGEPRELCWMVCYAMRQNQISLLQPLMPYLKALARFSAKNSFREGECNKLPKSLYRGGGFNDAHKEWFRKHEGKAARIPAFWATTPDMKLADSFMNRSRSPLSKILWRISFVDGATCMHVRRIERSLMFHSTDAKPTEDEYLFTAFPPVRIDKVNFDVEPYVIDVVALSDSKEHPLDLPLFPWY